MNPLLRITFIVAVVQSSCCIPCQSQNRQPQQARPNIVLIIADDIRYDSFNQTGGPSFFDAASIKRISDEGATFDNFYCVYSLCIPARATIFTGLYPHLNHAYDNSSNITPHLNTIATVLDSFGYHCAEVGKYHFSTAPQKGYEYWLATAGNITYTDPLMNYNGTFKQIFGNLTDIVIDTSSKVLNKIDTPFFISIEHLAPHREVKVQSQYVDLYSADPMPIPPDFYQFSKWYPSFLYDNASKMYTDSDVLSKDLEKYFEGLQGVEQNVDSVFAILQKRGLLSNTMIIFTGDNGVTYGDHQLKGKTLPYEPSMQLPLFIRYPKWFPNGNVHYNRSQFFSLETDIMPSILDAAKVSLVGFNLQGFSLKKLTAGTLHRDKFMFEKIKLDTIGGGSNPEDELTPSFRTLRTLHFNYSRYQCDHITEEYFDLDADSLETTNLIKEPAYAAKIAAARISLDSMQTVLLDTLALSVDTVHRHCNLLKGNKVTFIAGDTLVFSFRQNPVHDVAEVNILSREGDNLLLSVYNEMGGLMLRKKIAASGGFVITDIDVKDFAQGMYYVEVQQGKLVTLHTLEKE